MTERPYPDDRLPTALLALVLFVVCLFGIVYYFNCSEPQVTFCGCGHDESDTPRESCDAGKQWIAAHATKSDSESKIKITDEFMRHCDECQFCHDNYTETYRVDETGAERRIRKVWFAGGHPKGSSEKQFQSDVMAGLNYLASFTNTDFVQSTTSSGAYIRFQVFTNQQFWDKWSYYRKSKTVPLASHSGNTITFTDHERANGWVTAATIHETGHRLGIKHSVDRTSIMHADLPVKQLNQNDKAAFAKKLGKKLTRLDSKPLGLAA